MFQKGRSKLYSLRVSTKTKEGKGGVKPISFFPLYKVYKDYKDYKRKIGVVTY